MIILLMNNRPEQSIETIPSFDQWSLTIKTIETNGQRTPKPLTKIIDVNGQSAKKHTMVIVPSKTIENYNGLAKTIEIFNGLFTSIQIINCFLSLK